MSKVQRALIGLLLVSACGDEGDSVIFVGLRDGTVLGGPQTTTIDPDFETGAIHVDLLLDNDRIGADDFAPFEFAWNTTDYDEGNVELSALVTLGDGSVVDRGVQITIDNTPPVVSGLPAAISSGRPRGAAESTPSMETTVTATDTDPWSSGAMTATMGTPM